MYYEESWINGKLMYRTTPTGTWYVCTIEQCYRRIHELQEAKGEADRRVNNLIDVVDKLDKKSRSETGQMREALELIASPKRPDGTWNRDREACRQLAEKALGR